MTKDKPNPAAGGAAGSGRYPQRHASDVPGFNPPATHTQDKKRGGPAPHLRLVAPPPPPRPRRIDVRITASDGRAPIGRTRPIRLSDREVEQVIDFALRLEERA